MPTSSRAHRPAPFLPDDLLGIAVLGMVFSAVKTLVHRLAARASAIDTDLLAAGTEVSLGAALAVAAESNFWFAALLVPVPVLVERLHWRLIGLRREVATALETFASIVDERDRTTRGHSLRVAESVRELAEALALPRSDVRRLWLRAGSTISARSTSKRPCSESPAG